MLCHSATRRPVLNGRYHIRNLEKDIIRLAEIVCKVVITLACELNVTTHLFQLQLGWAGFEVSEEGHGGDRWSRREKRMFSRVTIRTCQSKSPTSHLVYAQPHLRALSLYLGVSVCSQMIPISMQWDPDSNTWRYKCDSAEVLTVTLNTYVHEMSPTIVEGKRSSREAESSW